MRFENQDGQITRFGKLVVMIGFFLGIMVIGTIGTRLQVSLTGVMLVVVRLLSLVLAVGFAGTAHKAFANRHNKSRVVTVLIALVIVACIALALAFLYVTITGDYLLFFTILVAFMLLAWLWNLLTRPLATILGWMFGEMAEEIAPLLGLGFDVFEEAEPFE